MGRSKSPAVLDVTDVTPLKVAVGDSEESLLRLIRAINAGRDPLGHLVHSLGWATGLFLLSVCHFFVLSCFKCAK